MEYSMDSFAKKIFRLIRERSHGADLSTLKQKGVRRVSVLKTNQLGDLIRRAVEQTLDAYGVRLSQGDLQSLSEDGRAAFLNLVRERDAYKEVVEQLEKEQQTLSLQTEVLKGQIERDKELLADEKEFWESDDDEASETQKEIRRVLEEGIHRTLERLGPSPNPSLVKFGHLLVEGISSGIGDAVDRVVEGLKDRYNERGEKRVENLERRIQKLKESLNKAEDALADVTSQIPTDAGLKSVYRKVQGLNPEEKDYEQKKKMLEDIFQLNVKIRDELR